ncbi:MAG: PorP/SprF family type IX secretion system membrane protein [Muribaculaceae bacterium]|nr:PorP/SprF family type IX secretion system membrane protein [Muribaculaceae bacterium]
MTSNTISRYLAPALRVAVLIAAALCPLALKAQTDQQFTQYYQVPSLYNPAAIASTDNIRVRLGGRLQWVGIEHAPKGFLLTGDMPFKLFKKRWGVGLVAQQESAGLFRNLTVSAQLAYKQPLFKGTLTAAVQVGYANEQFRGSEVFIPDDNDYHDPDDEAIPKTDVSGSALDLGVGINYEHRYFWAGVGCTHVNAPTITFGDDTGVTGSGGSSSGSGSVSGGTSTGTTINKYEYHLRRTLYFMAGSNIPIRNTLFEVMPSMLVKSDFTFTRVEVTALMRYRKLFSFGVGYRHDDAVSAIIGAEYKNFYAGYSYDYPISSISKASSGSHELVLGYSFKLDFSKKNQFKHKSIRIM